jgi:hypothetical protein
VGRPEEENWLRRRCRQASVARSGSISRGGGRAAIWNRQISNRPGTTILLPIVDLTRQMINVS